MKFLEVALDWVVYFLFSLGIVFFARGVTGVDLTSGQMVFIAILMAAVKS